MSLPLEVSKLAYAWLKGIELFFLEIHGKGATHIIYEMVYIIWSAISYDLRSLARSGTLELSLVAEDLSEFSPNIHAFQRFMEPWSD